nr:putative ribonuclease H-like domain-containing protein [Tanacetum cinerariifolium]
MTSDHNSSELRIHDHMNKPSSSKLVPKVVTLADKTATSRQDLELLFYHHITMLRTKADLEEQSLDDLFNNLKIYEAEVKGSFTSSQNIQNIAFVSSNNTDSTNESVNTALSVSAASLKAKVSTLPNVDSLSDAVIYSFFSSQSSSPYLDNEDLKQIDPNDLEEMDLKWQMTMLTIRARRFLKKTRRNLGANGMDTIRIDMSKVECYNCHRRGHFARECRLPRDNRNKETTRRTVPVKMKKNLLIMHLWLTPHQAYQLLQDQIMRSRVSEARLVVYQKNETVFQEDIKLLKLDVMLRDNALAELRKKFEKAKKERNDLKLTLEKFQNSSKILKSNNRVTENQENDRYKIGEGYHAIPPLYTGNFLPLKRDLVFTDDTYASKSVANVINVESSKHKTSKDKSKTHRPDASIIEEWISHSEDETKIESVPKQREPIFFKSTEHVKTSREFVKKVEHNKQAKNLRTTNQKSRGNKKNRNNKACFVCRSFNHLIKDSDYYEKPVTTAVTQSTVKYTRTVKNVFNKAHSPSLKKLMEVMLHLEEILKVCHYKLLDENHILLRVPRENNMYNVDLKNVVPSGSLTCLFAKATLDESNLWHRRLGHINFKTMKKLVKGNLVRGLPSNIFENNHTCVACQKEKQHKASFVTENQPNDNAGIKENLDAGKVGKETVSAQQYVLLPLWSSDLQDPKNIDDDVADDAFEVKENENDVHVSANESDKIDKKKHDEKPKRDDKRKSPIDSIKGVKDLRAKFEEFSFNSTNRSKLGIAGQSSFVDPCKYPDDSNMPELEDIIYSNDEEDVGVKADLYNLETNIHVLVDLPKGKRAIGSKWVFKNKKDELGFVIKNKARLVAHGHTKEEGIDYDEFFAPVARIEDIRLFLAYASFMGFMVYQMDVKSAFLYKTIEEEVYVCQPPGFEDHDYPNKVYKVVKALYGLHQAPRACYETLANYLLENGFQRGKIDQALFIKKQKGDIFLVQVYVDDIIFRSTNKDLCTAFEKLIKDKFQMNIKSASTPIKIEKPLLKAPDGEDMDVNLNRSMIESLIYLTSS